MNKYWQNVQDERGSASVLILGMSVALIIGIGFAVDGTRKGQAYSEATAIAEEAARAGGQALRVHALAAGQAADVTSELAVAEARRYITAAGATGMAAAQGTRIVVDTTISKPTIFLGILGIVEVAAHGHGSAVIVSAG
jgi:hypothetical protein